MGRYSSYLLRVGTGVRSESAIDMPSVSKRYLETCVAKRWYSSNRTMERIFFFFFWSLMPNICVSFADKNVIVAQLGRRNP
jgi:hypothetical protein